MWVFNIFHDLQTSNKEEKTKNKADEIKISRDYEIDLFLFLLLAMKSL